MTDTKKKLTKKNSNHQLSIVIPAFNEAHFLPGLFDSLSKHLKQPAEILVVDNGSSDNSNLIAVERGAQVIKLDKKTFPSIARNLGAAKATGNILIFLDADVEITERWAQELENFLSHTKKDEYLITGDQYHISKNPSWIETSWFLPLRAKKPKYINGGNIITTRETFIALGGFDESLETGEDVNFSERASAKNIPVILNDGFVALHEGYPKTIQRFIGRERWHGFSDFINWSRIKASKVACMTLIFIALVLATLTSLITTVLFHSAFGFTLFFMAILVFFCIAIALLKFQRAGLKAVILASPTVFLYFVGRSLSLYDALTKK